MIKKVRFNTEQHTFGGSDNCILHYTSHRIGIYRAEKSLSYEVVDSIIIWL